MNHQGFVSSFPDRKYLDIHSMHRLEKAATVEKMREYGFELGETELLGGETQEMTNFKV